MTDPKVLADALVEAGILRYHEVGPNKSPWYELSWIRGGEFLLAKNIITDWRVAGRVLESAHMTFIENHDEWQVRYDKAYGNRTREWHSDKLLPRAIIEAWFAALKGEVE